MPPRRTKAPEEKVYTFLSLEEMKARELKYAYRLIELRRCLSFIDDARLEIAAFNEQQLLQDKWQNYLTCNPLPKPYMPPDIRRFYSKLKYMEKENVDNSINWLLSVDERSVLSQDIFRQDLTRRNISSTLREDIGKEYNNYITDSLNILRSIEYFLDNDAEVAKCPVDILEDIVSRKGALQDEINDLLDRYTYRIISMEEAEMKSIDAITAEYYFNANNFGIHIWCLKNVAIRFSHLSEPYLLADFHSIKVTLHIPANMLRENLVVRALHMDFDHFSENAKSFKQTTPVLTHNINAGILDIHECLVNEWLMQMEIQAKTLKEMILRRLDYEEKVQQYELQMEKLKNRKKDDTNGKKMPKIAKPPSEPPIVETGMVPDIYQNFLEEEQEQYESFCKAIYEPKLFNFTSDEINLKQFFILGGIYQFYYVEKPAQNNFSSFNMTWHRNEAKLVTEKNIQITAGAQQPEMPRRSTRRMTMIEAEKALLKPTIQSAYFVVTIELPEYLCYWGEPIACHFEETTTKIKVLETPEIVEINKSRKKTEAGSALKLNLNIRPDSAAINAYESFANLDLNNFLSPHDKFAVKRKRLASTHQMSRESFFQGPLASSLIHRRKSEIPQTTSGSDSFHIDDFPIKNALLAKTQIRHMEDHIVPRIISSYKFPKEIQQEESEVVRKKPKGRGGKLVRQKTTEVVKETTNKQFTFNSWQSNPERMFAKFPKVERLFVNGRLKEFNLDSENGIEPETFAELLQVVNEIKKNYRLSPTKILNLKAMEQQVLTNNKRIRQMLRKKEISLMKARKTDNGTDDLSDSQAKLNVEDSSLVKKSNTVKIETETNKEEYELQTYQHWTTKHILKSKFDRENRTIILETDRLGILAFAFKRYEHFPFKQWSLEPNANDPNNEIIFTLDTQYVRCVLYITANGIRGHVTEASDTYVRNPKMYLVIEKPIKDYKQFKQLFREKNLNIFAEHDARFYVENGYFSEKHLSNELHTYNCMAVHSTQMRFKSSIWNRLAKRRDIILQFVHFEDSRENIVQVHITPGESYFVEVDELCSDDLDTIKLNYKLTWRNIDTYSDLYHLIVSMYPAASETRCKNPKLICSVRDLLGEIRPLSFS